MSNNGPNMNNRDILVLNNEIQNNQNTNFDVLIDASSVEFEDADFAMISSDSIVGDIDGYKPRYV